MCKAGSLATWYTQGTSFPPVSQAPAKLSKDSKKRRFPLGTGRGWRSGGREIENEVSRARLSGRSVGAGVCRAEIGVFVGILACFGFFGVLARRL